MLLFVVLSCVGVVDWLLVVVVGSLLYAVCCAIVMSV